MLFLSVLAFGQEEEVSADSSDTPKKDDDRVYGYHTTRYYRESDIYSNQSVREIDTTFHHLENYELLMGPEGQLYQDLGNIGSPSTAINDLLPKEAGISLGLNAYDLYAYSPENINYFDAQSPYSSLYYVQTSRGQQMFEATFNRNINYRWSVGFDFERIAANQQAGSFTTENHTDVHNFNIHTGYKSKNERYHMLFNFRHYKYNINELGGGSVDSTQTNSDLFDFSNVVYNLTGVVAEEARNSFHLYHQYKVGGKLKLFQSMDKNRRFFEYNDTEVATNIEFYPSFYAADTTTTRHVLEFDQYKTKAGVMIADSGYSIAAYYRGNLFLYDHKNGVDNGYSSQHFIGGEIQLGVKDYEISGRAETSNDQNLDIEGHIKLKGLEATARYLINSPTLVDQSYTSDIFQWTQSFNNPKSLKVEGAYELTTKLLSLKAGARFVNLNDFIYYASNGSPEQESASIQSIQPFAILKLRKGKFNLHNIFRYTEVSSSILRTPKIFNHTSIFLASTMYKSPFQLGIETYYRSQWNPYGYMPVTQQFYLQDGFGAHAYLVGDVFFNIKLKHTKVFLKFNHINQGLMSQNGYFTSPYYSGLQRAFTFGVKWEFFD